MSAASKAQSHASRVQTLLDPNEKIDELALAVLELAKALKQIEARLQTMR